MKKVLSLLFIIFFLISCNDASGDFSQEADSSRYKVVVIENCEYISHKYANYFMIHKQNCKFCIERKTN